ncbi:MAG: Cullin repeat-like-containing domain protein [Olpidium bornovanus]|uniref:Cullin repeat-like-containing domain protein n=1 Tax=Olpidium bornovanus TaxID=278681 RepID=A0A8H8DHB2_9FUNG|nr:MAG: Cullin repeat-like-containing domain protein [Olpidium bornovanus]
MSTASAGVAPRSSPLRVPRRRGLYNYCTRSRIHTGTSGEPVTPVSNSQRGANLLGSDLYKKLNKHLQSHLTKVRAVRGSKFVRRSIHCGALPLGDAESLFPHTHTHTRAPARLTLSGHLQGAEGYMDETLLNFYSKEWERYTAASRHLNHIFSYLNRHWVKREVDEGHKGVYDIYTIFGIILALVTWRDHLFIHLQHNVMLAVLAIVERQRNGEMIEASLIQHVIKSFGNCRADILF